MGGTSLPSTTVLDLEPVSYTHLRAHETRGNLVCRLTDDAPNMPSLQQMHQLIAQSPRAQAKFFFLMDDIADIAVLQCLDREGWLVTPLLNGCRVAVLSRACKQAL